MDNGEKSTSLELRLDVETPRSVTAGTLLPALAVPVAQAPPDQGSQSDPRECSSVYTLPCSSSIPLLEGVHRL